MTKYWKIPPSKGLIIFLAVGWALQACSPAQADLHSPVSTSPPDKHAEAFMIYAKHLEQEGLNSAKEIRAEESQPFIFILKPQGQEITDEDIKNVADLALRTVSVFESAGGLKHDDINMALHRPTEQQILLIKRRNMPELLSADLYGEVTIAIDKTYFKSLVNLAGPVKNGSQEFTNAWSVVQAICLAYTGNFQNNDPVCNIISANASAGWVGMERKPAADLINSYGMTELEYLGSKDYQYRYIDFVYQAFIR